MKTAKALGVRIDGEWRRQTLETLQHAYQNDPAAKAAMMHEYQRYLDRVHPAEDGVLTELRSTFWGWGATDLPLPLSALRAHVRETGLRSCESISSSTADQEFRVSREEACRTPEPTNSTKASACGASPRNECRRRKGGSNSGLLGDALTKPGGKWPRSELSAKSCPCSRGGRFWCLGWGGWVGGLADIFGGAAALADTSLHKSRGC